MQNIQKIEANKMWQSFPSYCQLVSAYGLEFLNPRNEFQDKTSEIYQSHLKEYKEALAIVISQLEQIKEYNFE